MGKSNKAQSKRPDLSKTYENILVISDMHMPFQHPDAFGFLAHLKAELSPDLVVSIGDILDGHRLSFHTQEDEVPSAYHEIMDAKEQLKTFYEIFPQGLLTLGNHDSRQLRKAKDAGIPEIYFKPIEEILEMPPGWAVDGRFYINTPEGEVMFTHTLGNSDLTAAQRLGVSSVTGHKHTKYDINYWSTREALKFTMTVGCLIDTHHPAFRYNKTQILRPIIGVGAIINGEPLLIPMRLDAKGRWRR